MTADRIMTSPSPTNPRNSGNPLRTTPMSAQILVDLHNLEHLESCLPLWRAKAQPLGVAVRLPRNSLVKPNFVRLKDATDQQLRCNESLSPAPKREADDWRVRDEAEAIAADGTVGHVLLVTSAQFARRFSALSTHPKITLCCSEDDLLSLWWSVRLNVHTLGELGSNKRPRPALGVHDLGRWRLDWAWQWRDALDGGGAAECESAPTSSPPNASSAGSDDDDDDDDDELVRSLIRTSGLAGLGAACSVDAGLADGRFVVPC